MENTFDLLLISPEQDVINEVEIVSRLFNLGLKAYHLRKPNWEPIKVRQFLESLPKQLHNKVILHSCFELTAEFEVKGVHLNEKNKELISQPGAYKIISASCHSLEGINKNTFPFEYVFLSPVFDSISKASYQSKFDLKLLAHQLKRMKLEAPLMPKVIALGGITAENVALVKQAGFSGAAILGAVWVSENPVERFLQIQELANTQS